MPATPMNSCRSSGRCCKSSWTPGGVPHTGTVPRNATLSKRAHDGGRAHAGVVARWGWAPWSPRGGGLVRRAPAGPQIDQPGFPWSPPSRAWYRGCCIEWSVWIFAVRYSRAADRDSSSRSGSALSQRRDGHKHPDSCPPLLATARTYRPKPAEQLSGRSPASSAAKDKLREAAS